MSEDDKAPTGAGPELLDRIAEHRVRRLLMLLGLTLAGLALIVLVDELELGAKLRLGALLGIAALLVGALALAARQGLARRVMLPAMSLLCLLVAIDCWQTAGPRDNALLALPMLMLAAAIGSATPRQLLLLLGLNLANVAALYLAANTGLVSFEAQRIGFPGALVSLLLLGGAGLLVVLLVRDLRQLSRAWAHELLRAEASNERAAYLLDHDSLTGLANRASAQRALREAVQAGRGFALMLVDIDDFSAINAALGQQVGDEVLRHLAERLREELQTPDLAARFGDDEFLLLWRRPASPEAAEACGRALLAQLGSPWDALDLAMQVRPLAGMASYPQDGRDADALLAAAQQALAAAKRDHGRPLRLASEADAGSETSAQRGGAPEWLCLPWQRLDGGEVLAVELVGSPLPPGLPLPALLAQVQRQLDAAARHALAWRLAGHGGLARRLRLPRDFLKRGEVEAALQQVLDAGGLQAAELQLLLDLDSASEDPQGLADLLQPLLSGGTQLLVELDAPPEPALLAALAPLPLAGLLLSPAALAAAACDPAGLAVWRRTGLPLQAAGVRGETELQTARALGCSAVAAEPLELMVLLEHLGKLGGGRP